MLQPSGQTSRLQKLIVGANWEREIGRSAARRCFRSSDPVPFRSRLPSRVVPGFASLDISCELGDELVRRVDTDHSDPATSGASEPYAIGNFAKISSTRLNAFSAAACGVALS